MTETASRSAIEQGTPRTDAVQESHGGKDVLRETSYYMLLGFARQLERELGDANEAANDAIDRLAELRERFAKACGEITRLSAPSSTTSAEPMLPALCEALGWQVGTIHQALAEVRRLRSTGRAPETPRWTDAAEAAFEKWWQTWREANGYSNTQRMRETARAVYLEIAYSPLTAAVEKLSAEGNLANCSASVAREEGKDG